MKDTILLIAGSCRGTRFAFRRVTWMVTSGRFWEIAIWMAMQQEPIEDGGTDSIYKAYFWGLNFREYRRNSYGQKYGTNVPPSVGSWNSHWPYGCKWLWSKIVSQVSLSHNHFCSLSKKKHIIYRGCSDVPACYERNLPYGDGESLTKMVLELEN